MKIYIATLVDISDPEGEDWEHAAMSPTMFASETRLGALIKAEKALQEDWSSHFDDTTTRIVLPAPSSVPGFERQGMMYQYDNVAQDLSARIMIQEVDV